MKYYLLGVYLTAILLLIKVTNPLKLEATFIKSDQNRDIPLFVDQKRYALFNLKQDSDLVELMLGHSLGQQEFLSAKYKNAYKALMLNHLFTPSGLHFTSCSRFVIPVLRPLFLALKWPVKSIAGIALMLCYCLLFNSSLLAFKRVCLLHSISQFTHLKTLLCLFLAFAIDFTLGGLMSSPLSFVYSFLFYSTVLIQGSKSTLSLMASLMACQIIIATFSHQAIAPMHFLGGMFCTLLFSSFFPVCALMFWSPWEKLQILSLIPIQYFSKLVLIINQLLKKEVGLIPSPIYLVIILLLVISNSKWRYYILIVCFLFVPFDVFNLPKKYYFAQVKKIEEREIKIKKVLVKKYGFLIKREKKSSCRAYMLGPSHRQIICP